MNVTFVGPGGTPLGTFNMDVPRTGDQVAVAGQGFTVAAVRFYTSPPSAAVLLTPVTSEISDSEAYQHISRVERSIKP
jgi:hypothetical protein